MRNTVGSSRAQPKEEERCDVLLHIMLYTYVTLINKDYYKGMTSIRISFDKSVTRYIVDKYLVVLLLVVQDQVKGPLTILLSTFFATSSTILYSWIFQTVKDINLQVILKKRCSSNSEAFP